MGPIVAHVPRVTTAQALTREPSPAALERQLLRLAQALRACASVCLDLVVAAAHPAQLTSMDQAGTFLPARLAQSTQSATLKVSQLLPASANLGELHEASLACLFCSQGSRWCASADLLICHLCTSRQYDHRRGQGKDGFQKTAHNFCETFHTAKVNGATHQKTSHSCVVFPLQAWGHQLQSMCGQHLLIGVQPGGLCSLPKPGCDQQDWCHVQSRLR
jgi:hypothetical protein